MSVLCTVLGVSRSGYYDWLCRLPSQREQANQLLDEEVKMIYMKHKQRYGAPRITRALKAQDITCSHTRVERLMKHLGLKAIGKRNLDIF